MQINKINSFEYKNQKRQNKDKTSFTGIGSVVPNLLRACDANPIMGVTVIDLSSMIIPRTIIDANRTNEDGKKNGFAAVETFARESMGLLVNCLSPALVALGIGSLVKKSIVDDKFKDLKLNKFVGDEQAIDNSTKAWKEAVENIDDATKAWAKQNGYKEAGKEAKIRQFFKNLFKNIEAIDGTHPPVKFAEKLSKEERANVYNTLAKEALELEKSGKFNLVGKSIRKLQEDIASKLGASRNIRYTWESAKKADAPFKYALSDVIRDSAFMAKTFAQEKIVTPENRKLMTDQMKKLLNTRGLSGMLVIMGIGLGTQKVNRMITEKRSGKKGFPGYKDFNKGGGLDLSAKEKRNLVIQKVVAAGAMLGLAAVTLKGTKLSKLTQFRGWFPTMDQAKVISATTYTGRILAADDKNELRESGIRDALGLISLYVLGDYVTKGIVTIAHKMNPGANLLNETKQLDKGANVLQKIGHWIKNVSVKADEEIIGSKFKNELAGGKKVLSQTFRRNTRSWAQAASIGTSMVLLGILLPKFNIWMTEKNKAKRAVKQQNALTSPNPSMMSNSHMTQKTKDLFYAFTK